MTTTVIQTPQQKRNEKDGDNLFRSISVMMIIALHDLTTNASDFCADQSCTATSMDDEPLRVP
jgi:hypothetical protein